MNPMLEQISSSLHLLKKNFDEDVKSLERYAAKPDAKQSYINERNHTLANIANAIELIETYVDISQLLYSYCAKLKNSISEDAELKQAIIKITLRDGDPMGKTVLID
jgi:putative methionine-R-sulfoxide reductase with GAF domain